ncbi:hypothetical protein PABG_01347 [Paracoccidioides brasiliensis Pb03]|nr:hypothetical protein PABG_01347 [Paracoccidioides brasiliensis Pb03]
MTYQLSASYCARYNKSKPPLPYFPGQEFCIHPHTPPAPATGEVVLSYEGHRERESTHPVDRCILHPPLPGLTGKGTIRLKVVGPVRIGDQHSAQLVTVHMVDETPDISDSIPTDKYLVAKLYDPLYFDHEQDDPTDCFIHLKELSFQNIMGPLHLNCQFQIKKTSRSIRLILIEKVPGISMQRLNPTNHTRSERQNILKAIVDAESMLYAHDIFHRDIHPRNVLVLDSAHRRVVLIDFGYCGIGRTPSNSPAEWKAKYLPGVPISPLLRWDQGWGRHANFHEWIDWDWQTWLEHCYESTRASITEHMRSIWLPKIPPISSPPRPSASSVICEEGGPVVPPSFLDNCRGSRHLIINQTHVPSARHPPILTATLPAHLPMKRTEFELPPAQIHLLVKLLIWPTSDALEDEWRRRNEGVEAVRRLPRRWVPCEDDRSERCCLRTLPTRILPPPRRRSSRRIAPVSLRRRRSAGRSTLAPHRVL